MVYDINDIKNYRTLVDMGISWINITGDLSILKSQSLLILKIVRELLK